MSCGGRVYKGDSITISIPFDVSGYTDLSVSYFTIGDTKIVRDESGLTVADGYITAEFSGHDLDLLPDGVVRYTIEYAVDNTDYVESRNTMLYLKTPASYDSITPEEIYQSGYTAGYDDCGEGDCSEIQNIAYNSGLTVGYESGYTAGQDDCPLDCDAAYDSGYTQGYQGGYGAGYQGGYSQGYQGGYSQGQADCPDCPACDCTEAYDSGYTQGYQGGYQGGYSVGYQGGYGVGYQGGYAQGQADCPDCPACDCTEAYQSGLTVGYNSGYTAGQADCPACTASTVILSGTFSTTQSQTWTLDNADESRVIGWDWIAHAAGYPYGANTFIDGVSIDDIYLSLHSPGYFTIPAGNHTFVCNASSMSSFAPDSGIGFSSLPNFMIDDIQNLKYGLFVS